MNAAVKKLHHDLAKLHGVQVSEKKTQAAIKTAQASEKAKIASIASQQSQILDQFSNAAQPLDAATAQKLLGQMYALGQQQVSTKDHFAKVVSTDKKRLATEHKAEKRDRKAGLKDLKPAEYHLSLKDTNAARHQLGLKALKKPVRAADPHHVTATMRRLAKAGYQTAMGMGGYVSHGLCATGVSRSLLSAMGLHVYGNGNQIDNNLPRSKFKQIHIPLSEALKIPGLVLTWEHTSTPLGRIYGHTAITTGDGHSSCSDFVERDTLAGAQSRTGLKIFMPIG